MKQNVFFIRTLFFASLLYPVFIYAQQANVLNINSQHHKNRVDVLDRAKDKYRLIIATYEKNNLQGLINYDGEWVIKPNYKQLIHKVGNYYEVQISDFSVEPTHQLYRLNIDKTQLELQPFYIVDSKSYLDRWVIVNQGPNNSFVKGLLDITKHQLCLPVKYNEITISSPFIITQLYDKKRKNRYSEVYNSENLKRLFSGYGYITIDKNNFLVQSTLCSEDEKSYYEYSTTDNNNVTQYCHQIYHIYDESGNELPTTYSHNFNELSSPVECNDKLIQ